MTLREHDINWLMGEFFALSEQFDREGHAFNWDALRSLAQRGAHAYNEGSGPSFHAKIEPSLVMSHARTIAKDDVNAIEGHLCRAELAAEQFSMPVMREYVSHETASS